MTQGAPVTELRLLRVRTGLTLRAFAKSIGMPETELVRIEKGQGYIPAKWRAPLAQALGVRVEDICDPKTGWPVLAQEWRKQAGEAVRGEGR